MHALIEPARPSAEIAQWDLGPHRVEATRRGSRWALVRSWTDETVEVVELPRVGFAFGRADGVAYLDEPVALAPRERLALWLEWPLELVVEVGGAALEGPDPGRRRTLLGPVSEGRVLPAAVVRALEAPEDAALGHAAVRVELTNTGAIPAVLRRSPIVEADLALYRSGTALVAGTMQVQVHEGQRAEASTATLPAPAGFERVARPAAPSSRNRLSWLLDTARRASEFQL